MTTSPHTLELEIKNILEEANIRFRMRPEDFYFQQKIISDNLLSLIKTVGEKAILNDYVEDDIDYISDTEFCLGYNHRGKRFRQTLEDIISGKIKL